MLELPVYTVRRAVDRIRIDGRLDEASWAFAPRAGAFRLIHAPSRPPRFPTEAALVWDAEHLYAAFACTDPAPWGRLRARDDRLWEEEVVEIFLDPDGDGENYAELEVSPHNVVVDLLLRRPRSPLEEALAWDIEGLVTAVARHDAGWVAEIAIPWRALGAAGVAGPPAPGDRWRAGLYRIKRPGGAAKADRIAALRAAIAGAPSADAGPLSREILDLQADDEYSAWSPTQPERGFHDPERFGHLLFVD